MKILNFKFLTILASALVLVFAFTQTNILGNFTRNNSTVRAVGDLNVDWGVPDGQPIFVVTNFLPGDSETRTVEIINGASTIRPVGVRGEPTDELKDLADILDFKISESGTDLYGGNSSGGPKTLTNFFAESSGIDGIKLFFINPVQTRSINFTVKFPEFAGNEFQNASIVFDIIIGIAIDIPDECEEITYNPIFGTEKRDVLNGTDGNDLIVAFEGDDVINAKAGNDCLIGGAGNDIIHGQNGNDMVFGDEGDDRLWGDNGKDKIYGGSGNDRIEANNDDDNVDGGAGNDDVNGGNGSDICLSAEKVTKCETPTPTSTSKKR